MAATPKTRKVDKIGRITLGKDQAGATYEVLEDPDTGVVTLTPRLVVTPDMVDADTLRLIRERIAASEEASRKVGEPQG